MAKSAKYRCARVPSNSFRRTARRRRGAAVVEFAIIAPLLILLILGIIEFGRLIMVQQILTNASREGARRAVLEQSTEPEVRQLVQDYLARASISGATVEVTPNPLSSAGFGDPVSVTCSITFDEVSWIPFPWILGGRVLQAETVMSADRPE